MRTSLATLATIVAHALLIGLLMGMSRSPVVGVVLPLLVGVGGYRVLDAALGNSKEAKAAPISSTSGLAWGLALWCAVVVAGVFTGIGLRNGTIRLGPSPVSTLSLIALERQPISRVPELTLICQYYDRLNMTPGDRRMLAAALSDTTIVTAPILSSLETLFASGRGSPPAPPSGYDVNEFHQGDAK